MITNLKQRKVSFAFFLIIRIDVAMYRQCIDITQFCNDLCIGHNGAMIRDTFVALWCSPIHAEPSGFAVFLFSIKSRECFLPMF